MSESTKDKSVSKLWREHAKDGGNKRFVDFLHEYENKKKTNGLIYQQIQQYKNNTGSAALQTQTIDEMLYQENEQQPVKLAKVISLNMGTAGDSAVKKTYFNTGVNKKIFIASSAILLIALGFYFLKNKKAAS